MYEFSGAGDDTGGFYTFSDDAQMVPGSPEWWGGEGPTPLDALIGALGEEVGVEEGQLVSTDEARQAQLEYEADLLHTLNNLETAIAQEETPVCVRECECECV